MSHRGGKCRSVAQRVGVRGENEFRTFAQRQGLLVTKTEDDFAIDFRTLEGLCLRHTGLFRPTTRENRQMVRACFRQDLSLYL